MEFDLLFPLRSHCCFLDGADVIIVMMKGFLFSEEGLELTCTIFEHLDLGKVPVFFESIAERLLEATCLLTVSLVHLHLEVNYLFLISETERR